MTASLPRLRIGAARLSPVQFLTLPLAGALLWLLHRRLEGVDPGAVWTMVQGHSLPTWALAILATGASFLAIGRYDSLIQRRLRTGVLPGRASAAGMRAIAVSQAAGFGLLTGTLTRWRCLPELALADAVRVTALVGGSFVATLAILLAGLGALGIGPWPASLDEPVAHAILAVVLAALAVALLWGGRRVTLRGRDAVRIIGWVTLDTGFAAMTLWLFLPEGILFLHVWPIYLAALGAGIVSNAPGGLGAFELTLLALLPEVETTALLSAVLAHRTCYQALPALLALPGLVAPHAVPGAPLIPVRAGDIEAPGGPDWTLTLQGARVLARPDLGAAWLVQSAPGCLVAIGRPSGAARWAEVTRTAALLGRLPLFYKIGAMEAARARRAGHAVIRLAQEAVITPGDWDIDGPAHRQLRRKLRQATRAGLRIEVATDPLPLAEMIRVNRAWRAAHGTEKGFSMGRFTPALIARQRVFLAWQGPRLAAFATFGTAPGAWGLDLMRHGPDVPAGAMHCLVVAAIEAARDEGIARLSLAAVPDFPGRAGRLGRGGLCQFKAAFAPRWEPLFAAAPHPLQLLAGLAAVAWAVHRPGTPLEDFGFELRGRPCQATGSSAPVGVSHG